ncbi:MAG: sugar transferase, partial [Faecalibacillus sp.]
MNRKIMPVMLLIVEIVMYYFICLYFHMDMDLIINSGILYFLFLFIYGHYSLNTILIWEEIKMMLKSSLCFYIALFV